MSAKQTDYHDPHRGNSINWEIPLSLDWSDPRDRAFAAILVACHVIGRHYLDRSKLFRFKPVRTDHKIRWASAGQVETRPWAQEKLMDAFGGYDMLGRFRPGVAVPFFTMTDMLTMIKLFAGTGTYKQAHAFDKHNFANPPSWFPDNYAFTDFVISGPGDPEALAMLQAFYAQQKIPSGTDLSFDNDPIYWTAYQLLKPKPSNGWATPSFTVRKDGTPYTISSPWNNEISSGIYYTRFGAFQGGWTIYIPPTDNNPEGGLIDIGVPGPSDELGGKTPPSEKFEKKTGLAWVIGGLILAGAAILGGGYYAFNK